MASTVTLTPPSPPSQEQHLSTLVSLVRNSKRCIVLSGAVPYATDDIYRQIRNKYSSESFTKNQLLSKTALDEEHAYLQSPFYSFWGEVKSKINSATPTKSHEFIKYLCESNRLLREYNENIDSMSITAGVKESKVVSLYGNISYVKCVMDCGYKRKWEDYITRLFKVGGTLPCPKCELRTQQGSGTIKMRPDLQLFGEDNVRDDDIQRCLQQDVEMRPDLVLVMGLDVHSIGLVTLVKAFSKIIKEGVTGKMVLINPTNFVDKNVADLFDFYFKGKVDSICRHLLVSLERKENSDSFDFFENGFYLDKGFWATNMDAKAVVPRAVLKKMESTVHVFRTAVGRGRTFQRPGGIHEGNKTEKEPTFTKKQHVFVYLWRRYGQLWTHNVRVERKQNVEG